MSNSDSRKWWEPRTDALSITHYRTEHSTYLDTEWMGSTAAELGWEAQYTWLRLVSGPEYQREGFPIDRLKEAFDTPREFDYPAAVESLLRAQLIVEDGGYYTFPNVIWGTPPDYEEEDA